MVADKTRGGLIGDRGQGRIIQRKIRRQPRVLRQREDLSERRSRGKSSRDEIRRLQRKYRRAPAFRQRGEVTPWFGLVAAPCPRPRHHQPVAIALHAEPLPPPSRRRFIHPTEPSPPMAHG